MVPGPLIWLPYRKTACVHALVDFIWIEASLAASAMLAVVVHECGHAGAAALCGVPVCSINIGLGLPLLRSHVGRTWFLPRAYPLTGFVYCLLPLDQPRWHARPSSSAVPLPTC